MKREKTIDVTAIGELLIDMAQTGVSPAGNPVLEANPGGAPCNVLAMVSRLEGTTAFIGKVGDDSFGQMLKSALEDCRISTEGLSLDRQVHTTLAFVHNRADGERSFTFYRNPGADMLLKKEEVPEDLIRRAKIFHFGTLSSTDEPARTATRHALELAKEAGCLISFDPNLREPLWKDLQDAKAEMAYGMARCHMLKIADNELQFFTGESDLEKGIRILQDRYRIPLICLSMGTEGSRVFWGNAEAFAPAFLQKDTIDTTGAGDCFWGCMLHCILKKLEAESPQTDISTGVPDIVSYCSRTGESSASEPSGKMKQSAEKRQTEGYSDLQNDLAGRGSSLQKELTSMLRFANAAASIITTRKGALKMMPDRAEIGALLAERIE